MKLTMHVNGRREELEVEADEMLLDVLRERLHLTGTKEGCREGECGACTVLVDGRAVDSCIYFALAAESSEVETVEGLASGDALTPLQRALVDTGGVQCGFCTPGIVMTLTALLRERPAPSAREVRASLAGNLCRCTGYTPIEDAVAAVAEDAP